MHNVAVVAVSLLLKAGMVRIMDFSIQREVVLSVMTIHIFFYDERR